MARNFLYGVALGLAASSPITVPVAIGALVIDTHSYQLTGTLRGETSVLDIGLSADDCRSALIDERSKWGTDVSFACVRER